MKLYDLLVFTTAASGALVPVQNGELLEGTSLSRRASCDVCVTTVKGQSTTTWGPFPIPYDQGGQTSRGIYVGCDVHIDRKRTTNCQQWSVWTSGTCGQVTKQQTC
uniref:Putative avirulence effector protein n=1 Tax=Fusarium oxysporum f. sp. apii TaxID=224912 RepID=A0A866WLY5_FUSOX|nr:putative avirulence effector protein [Fusarium oxysporum f. sp. apii]